MEHSSASGGGGRGGLPTTGGITAFLYLGFMGTLGFSGLHLLFCVLTSWVLGHDFSTVVYVTAATLLTGTVITFTFAFLVLINVVITAFSNFSQIGQNVFGGGGGGGIGNGTAGPQQSSSNNRQSSFRMGRAPGLPGQRNLGDAAFDGGDLSWVVEDADDIKLD